MPDAEEKAVIDLVTETDHEMAAMEPCAEMLRQLGLAYGRRYLSALHDPDGMRAYAENAWSEGTRIVIVGAHHGALAGMIEAFGHRLNVIYVPLGETALEAQTALLSGVQMPNGHPVNVMGINRGVNAALSAAKMLSIARPELLDALDQEHAERRARSAQALG